MAESNAEEFNLLLVIGATFKAYHHFFEGILEGMGAHALGKFSIGTAIGIASGAGRDQPSNTASISKT